MVFICMSLMANNVLLSYENKFFPRNFFICLLAICVFPLVKHQFKSFDHFYEVCFSLLRFNGSLHIFDIRSLSDCCSVTQLCLTLCDPMDCSTPGFPVLHCLPELGQNSCPLSQGCIQPSHPLSSPSPPAFNVAQHQGLF